MVGLLDQPRIKPRNGVPGSSLVCQDRCLRPVQSVFPLVFLVAVLGHLRCQIKGVTRQVDFLIKGVQHAEPVGPECFDAEGPVFRFAGCDPFKRSLVKLENGLGLARFEAYARRVLRKG